MSETFEPNARVHVAESERDGHTFPAASGEVDRDHGGAVVHVRLDGESYKYPHDIPAIPRELVTLVEGAEDGDDDLDEETDEETEPQDAATAAATVLRAAGYSSFEAVNEGDAAVIYHLADGERVKGAGELLDYGNALETAGWSGPGEHVIPMTESATATHTTRLVAIPPTEAERDKATIRNKALPIEERRAAFRRHNRRGNPFYEQQEAAEPTPRRVTSSAQDLTDETGYNGTNWPTYQVDLWLANDASVLEDATNHARMSPESLREYVETLLFNRGALPEVARKRLTRTNAHDFDNVRDSLAREIDGTTPRQAFDRIDWDYLRASLLGDED